MKRVAVYKYFHYEPQYRSATTKITKVEILGVEGRNMKIKLLEGIENYRAGEIILVDPENIIELQQ